MGARRFFPWLFVLLAFPASLSADEDASEFIGHWKLRPDQSEIYPASQWITHDLDIRPVGRLIELTEQQTFGEGENLVSREDKHVVLQNSSFSKRGATIVTRWECKVLIVRSYFVVRGKSGDARQYAVTELTLKGDHTLIRTTTVSIGTGKRKLVVLREREVFERV